MGGRAVRFQAEAFRNRVVEYGDLSATDGLAGVACGSFVTSGFENEQNLIRHGRHRTIDMRGQTAVFEIFTAADNDLSHRRLTFTNFRRGFEDEGERHGGNDDLAHAQRIQLPFTNASVGRYGATARGDALVGVTGGGTAEDPGETDLSEAFWSVFSARGTTYEQFNAPVSPPEPFDLSLDGLRFVPFFW